MFSACSIPNTDISLDQNSVFIFFWFYTTMLTSPLTFGHSLLLMLECKTAQALKIKTEKLLEGKSYFMAVAFKKVTHVTGNAIGIAIWIFLAECLRKLNETTKLRIQTSTLFMHGVPVLPFRYGIYVCNNKHQTSDPSDW